jgi:YfiH family protein
MDYSWRLIEVVDGFPAFVLAAGADSKAPSAFLSPALVTTRRGGFSSGAFESLNVSLRVGDDPETVKRNRELIARRLGLREDEGARPEQIHGDSVLVAGSPGTYKGADGLASSSAGIWLCVHIADCVPVFVFDPDLTAVGLAHAGRKGTAAGIITNLINVFKSSFQYEASQLVVALGPSVGPCCYELDRATASQLRSDCLIERDGRTFFDLWKANRIQAEEAGVRQENIVPPPACTSCRADVFFSHRAHRGRTGRQLAITKVGGVRIRAAWEL